MNCLRLLNFHLFALGQNRSMLHKYNDDGRALRTLGHVNTYAIIMLPD